eukprot:763573-Hanusia_phi.AAC.1
MPATLSSASHARKSTGLQIEDELLEIRAKNDTAVEDIHAEVGSSSMTKKLLVLNNRQASVFTRESIPKLFHAFELNGKPKLVVKLLHSEAGTMQYKWFTERVGEDFEEGKFDPQPLLSGNVGGVANMWRENYLPSSHGPSAKQNELENAKVKLVNFFRDVLIPLCAQTNAIVLMPASDWDMGAHAFSQAVNLLRSKWGAKLPFSTMGSGWRWVFQRQSLVDGTVSHQIRSKSESFRRNDEMMDDFNRAVSSPEPSKWVSQDLLAGVDNYILFEGATVDSHGNFVNWNPGPANLLENMILENFSQSIPCFTLRFTRTHENTNNQICVDIINSAVPVVFLDLRERKEVRGRSRAERLQEAASQIREFRDELFQANQNEVYDVCNIAFMDSIFKEYEPAIDKNPDPASFSLQSESLYDAIERKNRGKEMDSSEEEKLADLRFVVDFLKEEHMQNYWQVVRVCEKKGIKPLWDSFESMRSSISEDARVEYGEQVSQLLSSPIFYGRNVSDVKGLRKLIEDLVRIGRIPEENSLEGLKILREAWDTVDICNYVSKSYKVIAKLGYIVILSLGLVITAITVLKNKVDRCETVASNCLDEGRTKTIIFFLSLSASIIGAILAFYNPMHRWRILRNISSRIISVIWMYRTRVGVFAINNNKSDAPEIALRDRVLELRAELMESADISETSFMRKYPRKVYKHFQHKTEEGRKGQDELRVDNHHKPTSPNQYIQVRVNLMLDFYRSRLPGYRQTLNICTLLTILSNSGAAAVSTFGYPEYGAILIAFSAAIVSWLEFHGTRQKLTRYNKSLMKLNNITTWWHSISTVDKASTESISMLIMQVETIITGENDAWLSIPSQESAEEKKKDGDEVERSVTGLPSAHSLATAFESLAACSGAVRVRSQGPAFNHESRAWLCRTLFPALIQLDYSALFRVVPRAKHSRR